MLLVAREKKKHVTKLRGLKYDVWKHFAFSMSGNNMRPLTDTEAYCYQAIEDTSVSQ